MLKLFANGCSFTWGGHIFPKVSDSNGRIYDENHPGEINKQRLEITWPGQLSAEADFEDFFNYSMGCGSNSRIVRKTLDFFTPKILANEDLSDWFVVIQWTEPMRFEFFDDISKSWALCKFDTVLFENRREATKHEQDTIKSRILLENDETWGKQTFEHINCLGNFFKMHGIKYMFTSMSRTLLIGLSDQEISYCNSNFNWYNNDISLCSIEDMNVERCQGGLHPSENGHSQVAKKFAKFYKEHYKV